MGCIKRGFFSVIFVLYFPIHGTIWIIKMLYKRLSCRGCTPEAARLLPEEKVNPTNGFALPLVSKLMGMTKYANPLSFKSWKGVPGTFDLLYWWAFEKDEENVPSAKELDKTIPISYLSENEFRAQKPDSQLFAVWLGHATVLVEQQGVRYITDPVWCNRASFLSFVGPKRYRPPPMRIEDVPSLDFAVISHDHYDHLDKNAVKQLDRQNPQMRWFVPLGMKQWLESINIDPIRVIENNWGDVKTVEIKRKTVKIHCIPAQHWGMRGPLDRNIRLWAGWAVETTDRKFYYSGDTGFCEDEFRKLGNNLGPFDLAAIPIGACEPRWVMQSQHINPEEALCIHELIKSKASLGIHWGTYHMGSYEYYLDPKKRAEIEMQTGKYKYPFIVQQMGKVWEE